MAAAASSSAMRWAVGGWTFFIAENAIISHNRGELIEVLDGTTGSERNYHLVYGSISTAACASIAYGYFRKAKGAAPLQWPVAPPAGRMALGFALQAAGLALASQALPYMRLPFGRSKAPEGSCPAADAPGWVARCPIDFHHPEGAADGVHGVGRISRHAGLWSLAAVSLGAAAVVPSIPQAACLAMPTIVALVGGAHQDYRHRRGQGGTLPPEREERTSHVPFLAMLSGAQEGDSALEAFRRLAAEGKPENALIGVGVAALWAAKRGR